MGLHAEPFGKSKDEHGYPSAKAELASLPQQCRAAHSGDASDLDGDRVCGAPLSAERYALLPFGSSIRSRVDGGAGGESLRGCAADALSDVAPGCGLCASV